MVTRVIFRIFTSEAISDGICDAFRIFGCRGKKNIKTGVYPLPYGLDFSYLLVCGYIWSCILLLRIHKRMEWIKLMFDPTKQVSS